MIQRTGTSPALRVLPATVVAVALVSLIPGTVPASVEQITTDVETLAADQMEGRLTGEKGAEAAVAYIESQLEKMGAVPMPGEKEFRQAFEFTAGSKDVGTKLYFRAGGEDGVLEDRTDVQALSFSDSRAVDGDVVFAGYGLKLPQDSEFPYDSYAGLDVEGKIVVVLRYFPGEVDRDTRALLARYSGLRYKALLAREAGAAALLIVTGPNSPNAGEVIPMQFDTALSGSGIVAASLNLDSAEMLLKKAGVEESLKDLQTKMDTGNPHVTGFPLEGVAARLDVKVERERRTGLNVLGYLPATDGGVNDGIITLGAHYDHLGHGSGGNSLAGADEKGQVHNGADDNASGVSAVLEVGRALAKAERRRPVLMGFWGGEELGLLGSTDFVAGMEDLSPGVGAYLNFDMVGRLREDKLTIQAVGSSDRWASLIEQANVVHGFDVYPQQDPYLPTDSQAFYLEGVPTLNFFTGSHEDYHRPSDDVEKVNMEGIDQISRMATLMVRKLMKDESLPTYQQVERGKEEGGGRDSMRAFTGTIPDYTAEVEGLLLSGVVGGGPAEEAGLQGGDVIVEFGGQAITNIYDYTYALDAVKVNEPVQVILVREGERMELTLTPRAR